MAVVAGAPIASEPLVLRGSKVLLRSFQESDITEPYLSWLHDPEVVRYSNQRFVSHDRDSCVRYVRSFVGTANLFLSVRRSADDHAIGTMTAYFAVHHGTVDVGIMIGDRAVWGKGYGQDAWDTLTNWLIARDSIRKVTAGTVACNQGMLRLMERSGMVFEGARRKQELIDGKPEDILYFARWKDA
jgi:[ribosomal protein S5]-alanine N-acetyltransferase